MPNNIVAAKRNQSRFCNALTKPFYASERHSFAHKTNKTHNSTQVIDNSSSPSGLVFVSTQPSCVKRISCVNKDSKVYRFTWRL